MNDLNKKSQNIAIYGLSEYALMEAYLLSQHHHVCLVYQNKKSKAQLIQLIQKSQELNDKKESLLAISKISMDEIYDYSFEVFLFFDGSEKEFLALKTIQEKQQSNLIDCSSLAWQLINLKNNKQKNTANNKYFVFTQFPQQGELYRQLNKRNYLIIGANQNKKDDAKELIESIYYPFIHPNATIKLGDIQSVYLSKFILNSQLAFRITVMNEAARIAELVGGNIETIRECIGLDDRLGSQYLKAGTGFGGTSFMKDLDFLTKFLNQSDQTRHSLFEDAIRANEDQQEILFRKLWKYYDFDLKAKKIAIWGLSYKPDTSDISKSPAIKVIEILLSQGSTLQCFDPLVQIIHLANQFLATDLNAIELFNKPIDACEDADALLIFNELELFKQVNLKKIKNKMKKPVIFDGRNLFDLDQMKQLNIEYFSVGR